MKLVNPMTYGEAADVINKCDADDILIYYEWDDRGVLKLPIDNYLLFKEVTGHSPDEDFPMCISEDEDGNIMLGMLD